MELEYTRSHLDQPKKIKSSVSDGKYSEDKPSDPYDPITQVFDYFFKDPFIVGFDTFFGDIERSLRGKHIGASYPPFNCIKVNPDKYKYTFALAGFKKSDINISVQNEDILVVRGAKNDGQDLPEESSVVHRGISSKSFAHEFKLNRDFYVSSAKMEDGLLVVTVERDIRKGSVRSIIID